MSLPLSSQSKVAIRQRMDIPHFRAKGRPSSFSVSDMNLLVDVLRALTNIQIRRGETDHVELSDGNLVIIIGGDTTTGQVRRFKLKDVASDWLICHDWDGTTEGTASVLVAKPYPLRNSLTGETLLGAAHTYTYAAGPSEAWAVGTDTRFNQTRTDGGEQQRVIRPYVENEEVFGIGAKTGLSDGSGNPINFLEVSPSRQWAGPTT